MGSRSAIACVAGVAIVVCVPFVRSAVGDVARVSRFVVRQLYISRRAKQLRKPARSSEQSNAESSAKPEPVYVALGSSFAAGPLVGRTIPDSIGFMQGTLAYPQLLAQKFALQGPEFVNATSSGARLVDVLATQVPHLAPSTRLVTLTAGGNDVHYSRDSVLAALVCTLRSTYVRRCVESWLEPLKPASKRGFDELAHNFDAVFKEIRRRAPDAVVVVVTYATVFPPKESLPPLGPHETAVLREVAAKLRKTTVAAAVRNHAIVVDVASASAAHHARSDLPWASGYDDPMPVHPNEHGHSVAADDIYSTLLEMNCVPTTSPARAGSQASPR